MNKKQVTVNIYSNYLEDYIKAAHEFCAEHNAEFDEVKVSSFGIYCYVEKTQEDLDREARDLEISLKSQEDYERGLLAKLKKKYGE
jgi:hypothetical protein